MADDAKLELFGDVDGAEEEVITNEPVETPEPEVKAGPEAAGDKGEEAAPPAAAEKDKPSTAPITALLDERDKRQAAERTAEEARREAADLRRKIAEQEAAKNQPAPPDFLSDPDARLKYEGESLYRQVEGRMRQQSLQTSRFFAEREFGKQAVDEAYAFFDQHPDLSHQLMNHPSPFHAAVEFVRKQKLADEIGNDPAAYRKKLEAELTPTLREQLKAEVLAEIQGGAPVTKPRLPGSLAAAPSAGKGEPVTLAVPEHQRGLFGV